jgi:magnesium transporter
VNEATPQRKDDGRPANGGEVQPVERPWFFAGLLPSGAIARESGETAAGFRTVLDTVSIGWVDYVTSTDFNKEALATALHLGFSRDLVATLIDEPHTSYQDLDTELGIKIPSVQVRSMEVEASPLLILIRKNFVFTIHPASVDRRFSRLRRYGEIILKKIPADAPDTNRLALLLARIIDHNNDRNFEHLRQIEEQGDHLNEIMMDPFTPRAQLGPEIYHLKHALLTYLDALWNTVDVLHTLRYGDAELITDDPKLLDKLGMLAEDVNRQIGLAEHMSEVLASGLEVLQSIYNNQLQNLNNRLALLMTYLTIIGTAVLVPNTLATILGNAVFDIGPKDLGWYLALMIGSTVLATVLVYWWVKKRGWIPRKMD